MLGLKLIHVSKKGHKSHGFEVLSYLSIDFWLQDVVTAPSSHTVCLHVCFQYNDVIMGAMASQITNLTIVYSTVYSDADQRKHQSSASLAFEWGIHRGPVNSPHKWPVTRKMFPFDDVIMVSLSVVVRQQQSRRSVQHVHICTLLSLLYYVRFFYSY